ncbi:helix-turn-helix domain-containing protein [Methylomonas koyamae]|uniref:helix-turn-helix domain-containing protein n=2 Tax=Methylomonas TaxID=416 RepID=UPI0018D2DFA0|nr:helix-turn-helix transcriptional regulator [Methylomonas koyamae]
MNSPEFSVGLSTDGNGKNYALVIPNINQFSSTKTCEIFDLVPNKAPRTSFSKFDKLVKSLEENPETSTKLSEARKWVADTFYDNENTLSSLRLSCGLSQRQLGAVCGIEQSHVSRYEAGKHEPSLSVSATMANALGVNLETFYEAWSNSRKISQAEDIHD